MLDQVRDLVEDRQELDDAFDAVVWSHPLVTSYLKILKADENLKMLNASFDTFIQSQPYSLKSRLDLATGKYVLLPIVERRFLDKWWGTIVGDVVHDLRSALDQATFQLTCHFQNTTPPEPLPKKWRSISYPIYESDPIYNQGSRKPRIAPASKKLWGITSPRILTLIKQTQPFCGRPNAPHEHELWILNELWNIDKHRTVNLGSVIVKEFRVEIPGLPEPIIIDPGTPVNQTHHSRPGTRKG